MRPRRSLCATGIAAATNLPPAPPNTAHGLPRGGQSCEQLSHAAAQRQRLLDEKNRQTAQLIGSAAMLAPDVQTLDDAGPRPSPPRLPRGAGWMQRAALPRRHRRSMTRSAAALADVQEQPLPTRDLSAYTPASVRAELLRTEMEGASIQSRLDQNRGALAALGDPAALAAEQEQLTARIRALEEQYTAVELAEAAIQDAAAEMQRRFAPGRSPRRRASSSPR